MSGWPNGSLKARFDTECPACEETVREGENISYNPAHGGYTHANCPPQKTAAGAHLRPGEVYCLTCYLIHPEGACDRD